MEGSEGPLVALAAVLTLGTAAQWIAWRIRLPSILLLLCLGVLAGPVTGLIQPDKLLGDLLFPVVSLSVAVVLFEGSLSLRLRELQDIGSVLLKLLTVGAAITWVLSSLAAWMLLGMGVFKSILLGAVLVVTGPTVIGPLLRHVRPIGRVGPIARWEGIVIDPIGAVLALLVFEVHVSIAGAGVDSASQVILVGLLKTTLVGGGIGTAAALLVSMLLRHHLVPDHLQSPVTLMLVLASFVASNLIQPESGLLTVTVMGVVLANLPHVVLHPILEFKENLTVLLISSLFIVLAARLDLSMLIELGWGGVLFVVLLIVLVRPASVFASTWGSAMPMRERIFLACLAPRGIVAAAVSSVFALRLAEMPVEAPPVAPAEETVAAAVVEPISTAAPSLQTGGRGLVPATFLVIFGTVTVYGLTAAPLGRRLGLALADPQGVLIAGADATARAIAHALQQAGFPVLVTDLNRWNIRTARMEGLRTHQIDILSDTAIEDLDLGGIGRFFGMTPNDEVNSLAAMNFAPIFGRANVFQLASRQRSEGRESKADHLRARNLFGPDLTHRELRSRLEAGATLKMTKLTEEFDYNDFREQYGNSARPLLLSEQGRLVVITDPSKSTPKPGQTIIALVDPSPEDAKPLSLTDSVLNPPVQRTQDSSA